MRISVTKEFTFDMAHNLPVHDGACVNLHGHTYKLQVTVQGPICPFTGMVIDFKHLKSMVKEEVIDKYDHAVLVQTSQHPDHECFENDLNKLLTKYKKKVVLSPHAPTAEQMAQDIFTALSKRLKSLSLLLTKVKLWETPTSFVTVTH